MADSLRDEQLAESQPSAAVQRFDAPPYTPDEDAYKVDEANDPVLAIRESLKNGATLTLSLACTDGRREQLDLNESETVAWFSGPIADRVKFANGKIRERHAKVAVSAA